MSAENPSPGADKATPSVSVLCDAFCLRLEQYTWYINKNQLNPRIVVGHWQRDARIFTTRLIPADDDGAPCAMLFRAFPPLSVIVQGSYLYSRPPHVSYFGGCDG